MAEFAVRAIDNPSARNATLELGGPDALTPLQVVEIFENVQQKRFALEFTSIDELQAQESSATDALSESFAGLMLQYAAGDAISLEQMSKVFGLQLTSVRDYAAASRGSSR